MWKRHVTFEPNSQKLEIDYQIAGFPTTTLAYQLWKEQDNYSTPGGSEYTSKHPSGMGDGRTSTTKCNPDSVSLSTAWSWSLNYIGTTSIRPWSRKRIMRPKHLICSIFSVFDTKSEYSKQEKVSINTSQWHDLS